MNEFADEPWPVCVICEDHLRELLVNPEPGQVLLLGYLDEQGIVRALTEDRIREIVEREQPA